MSHDHPYDAQCGCNGCEIEGHARDNISDTHPAAMPEHCTRCGEPLDPHASVYLELNTRTGRYQMDGSVPPEESQGGFPFGGACAQSVLRNGGKLERIRNG